MHVDSSPQHSTPISVERTTHSILSARQQTSECTLMPTEVVLSRICRRRAPPIESAVVAAPAGQKA